MRETYEPGMTVSLVARKHGINANQLFHWRKLERMGSLTAVEAGESVVPAAELEAARRQIRELQRQEDPGGGDPEGSGGDRPRTKWLAR